MIDDRLSGRLVPTKVEIEQREIREFTEHDRTPNIQIRSPLRRKNTDCDTCGAQPMRHVMISGIPEVIQHDYIGLESGKQALEFSRGDDPTCMTKPRKMASNCDQRWQVAPFLIAR